jgi:hypothetical protein
MGGTDEGVPRRRLACGYLGSLGDRAGREWMARLRALVPLRHGESTDMDDFVTPIDTTLKGRLSKPGDLSIECVVWTDHNAYVTDVRPATCSKPHNGEFAGFYAAPAGPFPASDKIASNIADDGCANVVAHYLGSRPRTNGQIRPSGGSRWASTRSSGRWVAARCAALVPRTRETESSPAA